MSNNVYIKFDWNCLTIYDKDTMMRTIFLVVLDEYVDTIIIGLGTN